MLKSEQSRLCKVSIAALTPQLEAEVLELQLREGQESYLPDVASSLQMAARYDDACAFAIREGRKVVGFGLYGIDQQSGHWKLYRLMIDKGQQGRGLGAEAIRQIIDELRERHGAQDILVSYQDDNEPARRLYRGIGFVEYGMEDTKVLARLPQGAAMQ